MEGIPFKCSFFAAFLFYFIRLFLFFPFLPLAFSFFAISNNPLSYPARIVSKFEVTFIPNHKANFYSFKTVVRRNN